MNYKLLWCIVLLVVLIFPASASMVSFLVVETGLNEGIPVTQFGTLWEGGLMASFFDAGHIVTNSPILRMLEKPEQDLTGSVRNDFNDAITGGAEYFILGFLNYNLQGGTSNPVDILVKIYRTDSQELIYEQNFPAGRGRNQNEEYQFALNAGRIIISQIKDR